MSPQSSQHNEGDFLTDFIQHVEGMPVLVVGDAMVDSYIEGHVERVSPEAPVPVVRVDKRKDRLGGAANVALNIKAMGAVPLLCTVIGKDAAAVRLQRELEEQEIWNGGLHSSATRTTTVKTRVLSRNQQIIRVDEENTSLLSESDEQTLVNLVLKVIETKQPKALIFQDYNKGVLSPGLIREITATCNRENIAVCVDPKNQHFFDYKNCLLFKPNLREVIDSLPECPEDASPDHLIDACEIIRSKLGNEFTMITLGDRGLFLQTPIESRIFSAHIRDVADVSGAGDTVISVAALGIAAGLEASRWAQLANLAGGIVCESVGVVAIDREQLMTEAREIFHPG